MGKEIIMMAVSILSSLTAITALLLGQMAETGKARDSLYERLVRIEENQVAVRREIDALENDLTHEIRSNRDATRKIGQQLERESVGEEAPEGK